MSDLIDRQAAIELIERMKPYHQEADDIAEMIANMPSAQPELTQNLHNACTDLISRKEVIKLLDEAWVDGHEYQGWLHDEVNRLPSAQPEPSDVARSIATIIENEQDMRVVLKNAQNDIVHCRDCKFCYKSPDWKYRQSFGESIWCCKENRGINFAQTVGLDDYCSSAKRKE